MAREHSLGHSGRLQERARRLSPPLPAEPPAPRSWWTWVIRCVATLAVVGAVGAVGAAWVHVTRTPVLEGPLRRRPIPVSAPWDGFVRQVPDVGAQFGLGELMAVVEPTGPEAVAWGADELADAKALDDVGQRQRRIEEARERARDETRRAEQELQEAELALAGHEADVRRDAVTWAGLLEQQDALLADSQAALEVARGLLARGRPALDAAWLALVRTRELVEKRVWAQERLEAATRAHGEAQAVVEDATRQATRHEARAAELERSLARLEVGRRDELRLGQERVEAARTLRGAARARLEALRACEAARLERLEADAIDALEFGRVVRLFSSDRRRAQDDLVHGHVRAPAGGVVGQVRARAGARVQRGAEFLVLVQSEVEVTTDRMVWLASGQRVRVHGDGWDAPGTVTFAGRRGEAPQFTVVAEVDARATANVPDGTPVRLELLAAGASEIGPRGPTEEPRGPR